mmetsp:Transcript_65380/g.156321  ORF Transcript_65380/g.156321 Transcript_65380/m.156321 type:complete len:1064 (+) Transcript_65380:97-3288(+)
MVLAASEGTFLTAAGAEELEETENLLLAHTAGHDSNPQPHGPEADKLKDAASDLPTTLRLPDEAHLCESRQESLQALTAEPSESLPGNIGGQRKTSSPLRGKLRALREGPVVRSRSGGKSSRLDDKQLAKAQFRQKAGYYSTMPVAPGCHFWKALAERGEEHLARPPLQGLQVPFVETLVCAAGCEKVLFSPSATGVEPVCGEKASTQFLQHADAWSTEVAMAMSAQKIPTVLRKTPEPLAGKSLSTAIEFQELQYTIVRPLEDGDVIVYQRFVLPRADAPPSLLRIVWRDGMVARGFRIKARHSPGEAENKGLDITAQWTVSSAIKGAMAIELKAVPPKAEDILQKIVQFMQSFFRMRYEQVVIDLVQDRDGAYHFIQVKSFTPLQQWLDTHRLAICDVPKKQAKSAKSAAGMRTAMLPFEAKDAPDSAYTPAVPSRAPKPVYREPIINCGMCCCTCPKSRATKRITPKMMLETEHHLRKRGIKLFRGGRLRTFRLSSSTIVCDTCWALFLAESELQAVEAQLAVAVGINAAAEAFREDFVPFSGIVDPVPLQQLQRDEAEAIRPKAQRLDSTVGEGTSYLALANVADNPLDATSTACSGRPASQMRRSGVAVQPKTNVCTDEKDLAADKPHLQPAPCNVLQWRLLIYIDRLMDTDIDIMRLGKLSHGKLCLQMEMPWGWHEDIPLSVSAGSAEGEVLIAKATVHYVFSDPATSFPLHTFLSEVQPCFNLVWKGQLPEDLPGERTLPTRQLKRPSIFASSTPKDSDLKVHPLLSGTVSLARMLESPDSFLAESWVKLFSEDLDRQSSLRLTLGLVADKVISSDYVVLQQSHEDAWVPARPYFSSDLLPTTWMAIIKSGRRRPNTSQGASACEEDQPPLLRRSSSSARRRAVASGQMSGSTFRREEARGSMPLRNGMLLVAPRPTTEAKAVVAVKQAANQLRRASTVSTLASTAAPSPRRRSLAATTEDQMSHPSGSRPSSAPLSRPWSAGSLPAQGSALRLSRPWSAESSNQRRSTSCSARSRHSSADRATCQAASKQPSILEADVASDDLWEESRPEPNEA